MHSIKASWLGYGLLEAWSVCLLFNREGEPISSSLSGANGFMGYSLLTNLSGVAIVLSTLVLVIACLRGVTITRRRLVTIVAGLMNALGTTLILFGTGPVVAIGMILTGLVNAWLWVCWGDVFARLDTESAESVIIASAVLEVVVAGALMVLPAIVRSLALVLLVPISSLMYAYAYGRLEDEPDRPSPDQRLHTPIVFDGRFALRLVAGMGAPIFFVDYLIDGSIPLPSASANVSAGFLMGLLTFIVVLVAFVRFAPGMSISSICHVECSLIVAAIALQALGVTREIVGATMLAATLLCQYLVIMYATRLASQGFGGVTLAFAVMQLVNHASGLLGTLTSAVQYRASGSIDQTAFLVSAIALLAVLFALAVLIHGDDAADPRDYADVANDPRDYADVANDPSTVRDEGESPTMSDANERAARITSLAAGGNLSAREAEVLELLAKGRSAPFIRDELVISLNTVNSHIKHIYTKLGVHNRQEIIDLIER